MLYPAELFEKGDGKQSPSTGKASFSRLTPSIAPRGAAATAADSSGKGRAQQDSNLRPSV